MHSPYATTIRDLGTALRLSTMVTPRKSPVLEAIDVAIRECKAARRDALGMENFNDAADALDHLYAARRLAAGERS